MNKKIGMDVEAWNAEVATIISDDDLIANMLPSRRCVELLIQPTPETERCLTNSAVKT